MMMKKKYHCENLKKISFFLFFKRKRNVNEPSYVATTREKNIEKYTFRTWQYHGN